MGPGSVGAIVEASQVFVRAPSCGIIKLDCVQSGRACRTVRNWPDLAVGAEDRGRVNEENSGQLWVCVGLVFAIRDHVSSARVNSGIH